MGILQRIFGRTGKAKTPDANPDHCPHTALVPHWDNPDDMGDETLAIYRCDACGASFDYDAAIEFLEAPPAVLTSVSHESDRYGNGSS